MNVIDSSGWLEYLADGENAEFFEAAIDDLENLLTPTICIYEVTKRILMLFGEEKALEAVGVIGRGLILDLDQPTAIEAARLSIELKLAMADSIILATTRAHDAVLWTQDAHFKDLPGIRYIEHQP